MTNLEQNIATRKNYNVILSYNEEGLVSGITINYYRQDLSSNFEEAEIGDENAVNGLVCRPDIANIELKYDSDV